MNKVFVGSLSWNTGERELADFFSKMGDIEEVKVITDHETGRSRGFGFVTFSDSTGASSAVDQLDGAELDGRKIRVNLAEDKKRGTGAGGGGSGGRNGDRPPRRF